MSVSKKTNGKGWMFQFRFEGKKIKKELNPFTKEIMRTKNEAQVIERKYLEYLENEKNKDYKEMTLYQLFDEYVKATKSNLKTSTAFEYTKFKNNYLSLINDIDIKDLDVEKLVNWKNSIIALELTEKYTNRIFNKMKSILEYGNTMYDLKGALKYPFLEPFKRHVIIEHEEEKKKNISQNDFDAMISKLNINDRTEFHYYVILQVLYNTGLRIGELSALNIQDYQNGFLKVNKDYIRIEGVDYIQPPKNENSRRVVQLDKATNDLLKLYIEKYKPQKVLFYLNDNYVRHQTIGRVMKKLAAACGFTEYKLSPHILRHSHASNLKARGWNEYQIAKRLGHTPKVSTETYIHFDVPDIDIK